MTISHHVAGLTLGVAVLLLGYSTSVAPPEHVAREARQLLANAVVGISTGVAPNPYNTLAAQLDSKQQELDERESRLERLESKAIEREQDAQWAFYSLVASALLFLLVAANFYFDARRSRITASQFTVSLKRS